MPAACASVGAGLVAIPLLAKGAGLPPRLGALLAAGTSICGVTAIGATAPAIAATQAEVAVAVASVAAYAARACWRTPRRAASVPSRRLEEHWTVPRPGGA